ncbi:hypothetical protein WJX72_001850 [[Myrmecia] bisecta]|uniref:Protein kinase domain-containing protein n=1 Tax=[Myrmecia] bisecta TaxID=41462 RepID=A0AAW1P1S2_9CHLO
MKQAMLTEVMGSNPRCLRLHGSPARHIASLGSKRTALITTARAGAGVRVADMSQQVAELRAQAEQDSRMKVLMAGLRGSGQSVADFASPEVVMRLVSVSDRDGEQLPLHYDPTAISDYWSRRPVSVIRRFLQLLGISGGFFSRFFWDLANGRLQETEVARAIDLRNIVTSLGPAYIKLGQALSIRPDLLSPAAMNELQKLCDKVPSFDSGVAMEVIRESLGKPWHELFAELSPQPIAAASLGQVYKGRLKTGEAVAVKVQRPGVLETVTIDLFIIRKLAVFLRRFPEIHTDVVALLDEWASRFFEELDYVREGNNGMRFGALIQKDLPQVVVPVTYAEFTSRKVLCVSWIEGEKLSQSRADDVGTLVNVGVVCYLKQLLDTGFFHADPHPGNLIRTPDGRLAILDYGLMSEVDDDFKFGMIEAISHLVNRDYESILQDFVTLGFIPPGTDLRPILPVLAKVFDQALSGGGAKNINFQALAADLAAITYEYPFQIPPVMALIIRAIAILEGIALVGNSDFAIVDEAFPFVAQRLLTDDAPRLRAALKNMVYGKDGKALDADRLIDLLSAFETFVESSQSGRGSLLAEQAVMEQPRPSTSGRTDEEAAWGRWPRALPTFGLTASPAMQSAQAALTPPNGSSGIWQDPHAPGGSGDQATRGALRFLFSDSGQFFREFLLDETVKTIDALSRAQTQALLERLGLAGLRIPVLLPSLAFLPLAPRISQEDQQVVDNAVKLVTFLSNGQGSSLTPSALQALTPFLPVLATEILPELSVRLANRATARVLRDLYGPSDW